MKNKLIIICILFFCINISAQVKIEDVIFKAKLFTISKHNCDSKHDLINQIEKIPSEFFENEDYIFVLIKNKYYWYDGKNRNSSMWNDCDYYVCFSKRKNVFYLLGGFETEDILTFYKDYKKSMFYDWESVFYVDTLKEFIQNINLGRLKKAKKCFKECIETYN